ncbi:MAG TPA: capsule biosynthesis protein CapA [Bacteroidales bacterium]|nr:capsule biosynthesis protein CapA [Bacteroidales bacterium]
MRKILLIICLLPSVLVLSAQEECQTARKLTLLFIGDIMGHDEQIASAWNSETKNYEYDDVFRYIRDEISEADIAVANLEVTLGGRPYKGYPAFSSPASLASACMNAGIDVLATANNHSVDRGKKGILNTIRRLDSLGIIHTGTFADSIARDTLSPMIIERNGISIALLNYTYGTNGLKVPSPTIVNMPDTNLIASDIAKAKALKPDVIIPFVHWGIEYDTLPSAEQIRLAGFFFTRGANLVIGSHPHVLQQMEWTLADSSRNDRIVVYSLGNYVSNQRTIRRDGGAMVRIELEKTGSLTKVSRAGYYLTWVHTPVEDGKRKFYVLPCSIFENKPEHFARPSDFQKMQLFIRNSRRLLNSGNSGIREIIHSGEGWIY